MGELPALVTGQASTESRTVVTQSPDPTSVEFESVFHDLLDEALKQKNRKLLIVVDNLDRVEPSDALSIWSTLQTFLGHKEYQRPDWIERLWILIPYDDKAILRLWDRSGSKPESTDGMREGWANWDEGAYKGESLGSIGTDVTRQRVFSSRTGPRERSMEAGNRVIVRSGAAGCTRGPGGREFGDVGSVADGAVRLGVGWLAVGPGRDWPAQPRASPGEDAK